jgi:hypothetical protein
MDTGTAQRVNEEMGVLCAIFHILRIRERLSGGGTMIGWNGTSGIVEEDRRLSEADCLPPGSVAETAE